MTGALASSSRGRPRPTALGRLPDHSTLQLHVEGALNAVADAGLSLRDIDGIATVSAPGPVQVAHALGITPRWIDGTGVGGTSFLLHVRHAAAAIRAGYARTVLITHGESGRSRVGASRYRMEASSPAGQFEVPYGVFGPTTTFTIPLLRYMKEFGLTHEQLAYVAVAQRRWAAKNPRAAYRDPVTVEDVLASRIVAYPFHLLECCLVTDGGGALVVTSAERAGSFPKPAVHVLGTGESSETPMISQMADFTESAAFRLAGRAAFAEARIGVADVDHLMIYDAFAHVPIYGLEALGFTAKGEAGAFIADGNTEPGGSLPLNTNGGGLSYTHTGMYGMFAIQEGVRQLRGEAAAQVGSPQISVILGNGGMFATAGVLVLDGSPASDRGWAGQPQLSLTISVVGSRSARRGRAGLAIRSSSMEQARSPSSRIGWWTVVSGGVSMAPRCMSSKPVTAMSSGTRIPAVRNSRIAPIAIWSLPQAMASGSSRRGAARSSRTARWPLMAANRPSKHPSSRTPW